MTRIQQDTGSSDISAGTATARVGGRPSPTRVSEQGGNGSADERKIREQQLREKEALTRGTDVADFSENQRKQLAAKGQAMPDGSFPIRNRSDLENAVQAFGRAKNPAAVKAHIIKRAKALGASDVLPADWGDMTQESSLTTFLSLEGELPGPVILQEATEVGKFRVRVPFFVGESVSNAPGFQKKIYFPRSLLPSVIQEGKKQISDGKQPLTVYARHAHATSGDHLPVGAVVDLEQEGRVGYATLEIADTSTGRDIQALIRSGHLNAVSLRSGSGRFELEQKKVNGEPMLQASRLAIDGIDFAPDSPAMPTYGIEMLAAEARVESHPTPKRRKPVSDELTLETIKGDYPEIVAEIEAPLRKEIKKVEAERDALFAEKQGREREAYLTEISAKFPEPETARAVLAELCKDCKSRDEIAVLAMPVLLEGLERSKNAAQPTQTPREKLMELFPKSGAGASLTQESTTETEDGLPRIAGLRVPMA